MRVSLWPCLNLPYVNTPWLVLCVVLTGAGLQLTTIAQMNLKVQSFPFLLKLVVRRHAFTFLVPSCIYVT